MQPPVEPASRPPEGEPGPSVDQVTMVSEAIESAIAITEKAVFQTGAELGAIVDESQRQVEELAEILPRLDGSSNRGGIAEAIERQTEVVRTFVGGLVERAGQQADTAQRAAGMSAGIAAMASEVGQIAVTSRVLSLNATIECARLGDAGRAMSVIAHEMEQLSSAVRKANAQIAKLAEDLGGLLPRVVDLATELQSMSSEFSGVFSERQRETEGSFKELVTAAGGAFERSRQRVDRILKRSQDALSALQFQDPVAQRLRHAKESLTVEPEAASEEGESQDGEEASGAPELGAGDTLMF